MGLAQGAVQTADHAGDWSGPEQTVRMRVLELEEQLHHMHAGVIIGLNQLLDLKDVNTGVHSTRLAEWAVRIARELGIEENCWANVEAAALLHDIGKIGVPDAILKKPGPLSDDERALMNRHPEYGWAIQRLFPSLAQTSLLTLHHHERYDGKGYPAGLCASEIPLGARIISVIDAFDAMISNRPYRLGLPYDEAIRCLIQSSGIQFDPAVVRCFVHIAVAEAPAVFAATGTSASGIL